MLLAVGSLLGVTVKVSPSLMLRYPQPLDLTQKPSHRVCRSRLRPLADGIPAHCRLNVSTVLMPQLRVVRLQIFKHVALGGAEAVPFFLKQSIPLSFVAPL